MKNKLERFGSFGAIIAAAACPVCFPKLALIGALLGMGALAQYEVYFFYGAQILVLLTLVGNIVSFKKHRNITVLALVIVCTLLFFASLYLLVSEILSYLALAGLITGAIWSIVESKRCDRCATQTS